MPFKSRSWHLVAENSSILFEYVKHARFGDFTRSRTTLGRS